ncbi:hypothetical protein CHCC20327_0820 [Bacillus licheniformis]|nr:hypothetical protein CHCC20327_0820 [Bacillus licheniformis]
MQGGGLLRRFCYAKGGQYVFFGKEKNKRLEKTETKNRMTIFN